jgi:hypothetical protein
LKLTFGSYSQALIDSSYLLPRIPQPFLSSPYPKPNMSCLLPRTVFVSGTLSFALSADVTIRYKTAFDLTKKSDGQTYLQTLTQELRMDPKTGTIYAGNLFNGNKLLGEIHVLQFSNCSKLCLDVITV